MIIPHHMSGKTVAILGLGRSGMSACSALQAAGAICFIHDDQIIPDNIPSAATAAPPEQWPWQDLDALVISPGIPSLYPTPHPAAAQARANDIPIISDIELFMQSNVAARVIGITGTNGKSTTTALTTHIINQCGIPACAGGNIGMPVMALDDPGADGVIVLELSSYQLEITPSLRLDAAAILNITPDHLDRHGGWAGYKAAKAAIADAVDTPKSLILGDDDSCHEIAEKLPQFAVMIDPDMVSARLPNMDLPPSLLGCHNLMNIAAAMLICDALRLHIHAWDTALTSFHGLAHRMEWLGETNGVQFINDSKATNGMAAAKALASYPVIYWIVGGQMKNDGLGEAMQALDHVRYAFVIGDQAEACATMLTPHVAVDRCHTIENATRSAFAIAQKDQLVREEGTDSATILLSPAAASFDQFKNFEHRGDVFRDVVNSILSEARSEELAHV